MNEFNGNSEAEKTLYLPARFFDQLLEKTRAVFGGTFLDESARYLSMAGLLSLYVSGGIGFILSIVLASKLDSFMVFLMGLGWLLACAVLQYLAVKFLSAGKGILESSPTRMSGRAFVDSVALVNLIGGILALIGFTVTAINQKEFFPFILGIAVFLISEYWACIALNPEALNIRIQRKTTAGEEAIGLISFFVKGLFKLIPIAFGIWGVMGALGLIGVFFQLKHFGMALQTATSACLGIVWAALLPLAGFLLFIFYHLFLDLLRAVLYIPFAGKEPTASADDPGKPVIGEK